MGEDSKHSFGEFSEGGSSHVNSRSPPELKSVARAPVPAVPVHKDWVLCTHDLFGMVLTIIIYSDTMVTM